MKIGTKIKVKSSHLGIKSENHAIRRVTKNIKADKIGNLSVQQQKLSSIGSNNSAQPKTTRTNAEARNESFTISLIESRGMDRIQGHMELTNGDRLLLVSQNN